MVAAKLVGLRLQHLPITFLSLCISFLPEEASLRLILDQLFVRQKNLVINAISPSLWKLTGMKLMPF